MHYACARPERVFVNFYPNSKKLRARASKTVGKEVGVPFLKLSRPDLAVFWRYLCSVSTVEAGLRYHEKSFQTRRKMNVKLGARRAM